VVPHDRPCLWRWEILSTRLLANMFLMFQRTEVELQPAVHLFLADRYWRLAAHYEKCNNRRRAAQLDAKARWHHEQGGGDDLRPAASAATARPRPNRILEVVARRTPDA
jgi:hypothetical protein